MSTILSTEKMSYFPFLKYKHYHCPTCGGFPRIQNFVAEEATRGGEGGIKCSWEARCEKCGGNIPGGKISGYWVGEKIRQLAGNKIFLEREDFVSPEH